ncbi:MAG: HIT domain-containing protein [Anaerolineae bacterium]
MAYLKQDTSSEGGRSAECLFCRKAAAQDDAAEHVLHRAQHCYVTLNLYPYNNGHLLVVPYQHTDRLEALSPEAAAEMMAITRQALVVLGRAYRPDGFNIGINQGAAAGAGIAAHLHQHVVPRWAGDTNFLSTIAQTRTIPEWIDETYRTLKVIWDELDTST